MNNQSELEKIVIGKLFYEVNYYDLQAEDFAETINRKIFLGFKDIFDNGKNPSTIYTYIIENQIDNEYIKECKELESEFFGEVQKFIPLLKKIGGINLLKKISNELINVNTDNYVYYLSKLRAILSEAETKVEIEDMRTINIDNFEIDYSDRTKYIPTGFPKIDLALNELATGLVTLIVGRSSEGKTTFTRQIIANAINTNNKTLWIMGENSVNDEIQRLYEIVIGDNFDYYEHVTINTRKVKKPKKHILEALKKWHRNRLFVLNKTEAKLKTHEELLNIVEHKIKEISPTLIVIDNLMSVLTTTQTNKNTDQSDFMQRLCDISKLGNVHIILILHPNKEYRKANKQLDYEHIAGSSDLYNKADNIITVKKVHKDEEDGDKIQGVVEVTKNRIWGDLIKAECVYDFPTRSLIQCNLDDRKKFPIKFNLEKYIDKKLVYNNGFEEPVNEGWRKEND